MGIGDWGLGIGDWGLGDWPNPQSFCAFFDSYLLRLPERPDIRLQAGETADYRWLTPAEVDELCAAGRVAGPIREDWALLREKLITELDAWKIKDKQ